MLNITDRNTANANMTANLSCLMDRVEFLTEENALLEERIVDLEEQDPPDIPVLEGAVLAFDTPRRCPQGWSAFGDADSRVIVGAFKTQGGSPGISPSTTDANGVVLQARDYRATGGTEAHTLTVGEMPPHDHGGRTGVEIPMDRGAGGLWFDAGVYSNFRASNTTNNVGLDNRTEHIHSIPAQGGGQAHNNMPPFLALWYCKKD